MTLKVYADRMSQPSRAVLIFCKVNKIDFEEVKIDISKRQHHTAEFRGINPMEQVPAITDGRFKMSESHAIMSYLACSFPGVPDHWYPADLSSRAKVQAILDWHHSNLRRAAFSLVLKTVLGPANGLPLDPQSAKKDEELLNTSLSKIESTWLQGNAKFLLGNLRPSIADLSLVCEIMQIEVLDEKDRVRVLAPHPKILQWIDNVKNATNPHFEQVHGVLYKAKARLQSRRTSTTNFTTDNSMKFKVSSKL